MESLELCSLNVVIFTTSCSKTSSALKKSLLQDKSLLVLITELIVNLEKNVGYFCFICLSFFIITSKDPSPLGNTRLALWYSLAPSRLIRTWKFFFIKNSTLSSVSKVPFVVKVRTTSRPSFTSSMYSTASLSKGISNNGSPP